MDDKLKLIKKINKTIINPEEGTVDSFDKQLIKLMSGVFDTRYPMVVSLNSECISYAKGIDKDAPLLINVSTVIKIKDKHDIGYEFVSNCERMLKNSVLAFESLTHDNSMIFLLNEFEANNGNPIIAICRYNKDMGLGGILVNEITSIYDKKQFAEFIKRSYKADKVFYKNKKTELYFIPNRFQLPEDINYALSANYSNLIFSKSQVEKDIFKYNSKRKPSLDSKIFKAEKYKESNKADKYKKDKHKEYQR